MWIMRRKRSKCQMRILYKGDSVGELQEQCQFFLQHSDLDLSIIV